MKLEWHPDIFGPVALASAPNLEGWRLPTRAELIALFDSGDFPKSMRDKCFWSSTPHAPYPSLAWSVYFDDGNTFAFNTTYTYYVRLVREAPQLKPVAWGAPDALGNIIDTITSNDKTGELRLWESQYSVPLYTAEVPAEQSAEIESLRAVSDEYNAWIRHHAGGGDYEGFLRQRGVFQLDVGAVAATKYEPPAYWCVICQRPLPIVDGVIVHDNVPHPDNFDFNEMENPQ